MGYRSDVSITCNKAALKELFKRLKKEKINADFFDIGTVNGYEDQYILNVDSVKWYSGFPVVDLFEKWRSDCMPDDEELSGDQFHGFIHFIRIGEDYDDIEDDTDGEWQEDDLYVQRYIDRPDYEYVNIIYPASYKPG